MHTWDCEDDVMQVQISLLTVGTYVNEALALKTPPYRISAIIWTTVTCCLIASKKYACLVGRTQVSEFLCFREELTRILGSDRAPGLRQHRVLTVELDPGCTGSLD